MTRRNQTMIPIQSLDAHRLPLPISFGPAFLAGTGAPPPKTDTAISVNPRHLPSSDGVHPINPSSKTRLATLSAKMARLPGFALIAVIPNSFSGAIPIPNLSSRVIVPNARKRRIRYTPIMQLRIAVVIVDTSDHQGQCISMSGE